MELEAFLDCVQGGTIPPEPPRGLSPGGRNRYLGIEAHLAESTARDVCIVHGMWAIVDREWTGNLADWLDGRSVLEIMAGAGWLARALMEHGVDVIATDDASWNERHHKAPRLCPVLKFEAQDAVDELGPEADVLLVSWPPYGGTAVCKALESWKKPVVYIGEGEGGCNAPDEFWARFYHDEDAPKMPMVSWWGLHDYVWIGKYGGDNLAAQEAGE